MVLGCAPLGCPKNKIDIYFFLKLLDCGTDILIDGESFEFPIPKLDNGFPIGNYRATHYEECENGDSVLLSNEIVLIKFCQIDEPSLKFWRSLVRQFGSNGNPFQEPLNIVSNVNGGYGGWTGYGSIYYEIPIIDGFSTNSPIPLGSIEITDVF
mgnify:CR=1 FL=1